MSVEIVVPDMGEAGLEATVSRWLKQVGEAVKAGEAVVVLETDKVDLEVAAEADGTLESIDREAGQDVEVGEVLGHIDESRAPSAAKETQERAPVEASAPAETQEAAPAQIEKDTSPSATPVARRMAEQQNIDLSQVSGSGVRGRVTREDVEKFQSQQPARAPVDGQKKSTEAPARSRASEEERVPMSRRRRTIARRLVEAQQTAAMLTTFNDVDMSAVMEMRKRRKEAFQERHGVSLGLSSFFVKAAIGALKAMPQLNAEIDGDDTILKRYYDIGVAIGAEEGLVVPVLRDADRMSFADIEAAIKRFAKQAGDGTLSLDDLRGGSFTITNGGIFGSLLSTPILNPPQVAILGLHRIEDRPIALNGEVVIRPMMYMALSYDHRIVDGREAVQFLVRIKQLIEDPEVLLIEG
ncbi:MAG: 2-oxoglutarate dehydrogenase complex dihydrolipoyllysine-residue succinyltransferase [Anaerolineae bacterium]|nr:2-oxoglutarate dehydrogenase complex dihydrolipoyllysine-residue succinyltransferase [Anaerolineae bacterium]